MSALNPPPPPAAALNANLASDVKPNDLKCGHSQSQPQARCAGMCAESVLDSGTVPASVVPPAVVAHELSPGLSTARFVVPSSSESAYAPASPAVTNVLWPCAPISRNASSKAISYAGLSAPDATAVSITVSASPQLVDTVPAAFWLAAA